MVSRMIALLMSVVAMISSMINMNVKAGAKVFNDIAYGSEEIQTFDLALPGKTDGEVGLLLMLHGGSWVSGDKGYYSKYLKEGASRYGVACATMNYRLLDTANMFDMLDDISSAMKKIKSYASKKSVKITKVMLLGYSAGAHLALLYSYTRFEKSPLKIVAVASFSGPTDFTDDKFIKSNKYAKYVEMKDLATIAVGYEVTEKTLEKAAKSISPAFQVKPDSVPTLVCHGKKDGTVPYSNAKTLVAALKKNNVPYVFIPFNNSGHNLSAEEDKKTAENADKATRIFIANYLLKGKR